MQVKGISNIDELLYLNRLGFNTFSVFNETVEEIINRQNDVDKNIHLSVCINYDTNQHTINSALTKISVYGNLALDQTKCRNIEKIQYVRNVDTDLIEIDLALPPSEWIIKDKNIEHEFLLGFDYTDSFAKIMCFSKNEPSFSLIDEVNRFSKKNKVFISLNFTQENCIAIRNLFPDCEFSFNLPKQTSLYDCHTHTIDEIEGIVKVLNS